MYFVREEDCWGLLGVSPTLVNLVEDHRFISEEYYLYWYETFWGSPKQSHESFYAQSGRYHTSSSVMIPNICYRNKTTCRLTYP